ncbi:DUF1207 domain-containing protein [Calycomorphotria hydatis]|uniref:DUF1207 domain-containing protein n=1 Tax=Calycomorphotria hydatis TaxID=2528027 RepID=A0A517T8Y7_9PLAN|nr:DUF1207 domain-containing protein [Calycomorphotria hydatis]QDT64818.1 hypothetical protein V22_20610 [Calycomorphotria hydatis]
MFYHRDNIGRAERLCLAEGLHATTHPLLISALGWLILCSAAFAQYSPTGPEATYAAPVFEPHTSPAANNVDGSVAWLDGIEPLEQKPIQTVTHETITPPTVFTAPEYYVPNHGPAPEVWRWHLLPEQVIFKPYIAGIRTPRLGAEIVYDDKSGDTYFDSTLGGTVSILQYGTGGPRPEGWDLGVSAAAFLRQNGTRDLDVDAVDFRVRVPISYRIGGTAIQFGYDHISSHAGDEFLVRNPGFVRLNYLRDSLIFAVRQDIFWDLNVYAEIDYAVNRDISKPWLFQFGAEYTPQLCPGWKGAPVIAINTQLREDFDFDGNLSIVAGWQWLSPETDNIMRFGLRYYTGNSQQYSFYEQNEHLIGIGLWYDF